MANSQHPHPDHDSHDPAEQGGETFELNLPSEGDSDASPDTVGESSQTFISDEFDGPVDVDSQTVESDVFEGADDQSQTVQSDEFDDPAADSQTFVSDEFDEPVAADSRTVQSDEFDDGEDFDSQTVQSDEFGDGAGFDSQTVMSDEFDEGESLDSQTIMSDEFDEGDLIDRTIGAAPDIDRTVMTEDPDGPNWGDAGGATMMADIDGTDEHSRTLMSDEFGDGDDQGLMEQSNINQTINPKSMDSKDRKHWESVIRGAVGSSKVPHRSRRSRSSLVGVKSNLNIQTRTLIEGQPAPGVPTDYRIDTKLGEGGMGAVYLANQTSLNRNVALKVIKPISPKETKRLQQSRRLQTVQQHRQGQFLSEAVVTGDLEHPNIVPIYDVAATQDGTVFYSMKCVSGTPWSKVVRKKSLGENVDILMKVCDAMAFAHSRGVVHRDLKPENVMLGEFGVVLVMDWGLALVTDHFSKHDSVKKASSLGGSPAYMAPELATGPLDRIGPAADIYLIGAMLYEIITGRPPHSGSNVSQCLRNAATNKIEIKTQHEGELMDIAMQAMATKPEERYETVQDFQDAVRGYLAHAESIGLARKAKADLLSARDTEQYSDYARAMFGFEQALDLWEGNEPARQGLSQAQLAYAEHALAKQDYELGLSLLDQSDPAHTPVVSRLQGAQKEQESRKARLTWMKRVAAGLLAVIFVGGSGALAVINEQKQEAVALKEEAVEAKEEAVQSRDLALAAQAEAERAAEQERLAKEAEAKLKVQAIALKDAAEKSAEAEKAARLAADEAKRKAEQAAEQERLAKEAEAKLKVEAIALKEKAEQAAEAEMKAKLVAVAAQKAAEEAAEAEKKAKELAVEQQKKAEAAALAEKKAKELETKAKLAAVAAEKEAVEERKKAELAAEAEKKAKELETKAKLAAIAAEKEAVAQRMKAEQAAEAEKKAKVAAVAAQKAEEKAKEEALAQKKKAEEAALAEMKAKELETKAKEEALAAKEAETQAKIAAIEAEKQAQYEAYVSKIGLAKARIDQNEFDGARELLQQLRSDKKTAELCGWEWSRLMHQASQATSNVSADEPARDVSFSETGRRSVAVLEGGDIELLRVSADGRVSIDEKHSLHLDKEATSAAISETQQQIVTGEADGTIRLWSLESGREVHQFDGHTDEITKVRFLSDGRLLSSSLDKTLRLWDGRTGRQIAVAWHIAPVQDFAFSDGDAPVVAAAIADARSGRGVVWQLGAAGDNLEFAPLGDFLGHAAPVFSVAVSRDGRQIASGDGDGRIYVWNRDGVSPLDYGAAIDAALARIEGEETSDAKSNRSAAEFTSLIDPAHPQGTLTLLGNDEIVAHRDAVRALDFSDDGRRLLSSADDFTIKVWDRQEGTLEKTLRGHGGWVRSVQFSPENDDVILSAGYDRSVKSWKMSKYAEVVMVGGEASSDGSTGRGSPDVQAHDDEIWSAHFSRDGSRIVTTSRDRSAKLWTVVTDGPVTRVRGPIVLTDEDSPLGPHTLSEGHKYLALSFHATADGKTLLIGGVDGTIRLFDVRRGIERGVLSGCGLNTGFAVSEDGSLLLSASSELGSSALLWELDADDGVPASPKLKLAGHEHPVTAFAISRDGRRLYTGDQRGNGRLWDATGEQIGDVLTYHEGLRINDAAFLPDGRLVTGSDDLSIAVFDPESGEVQQKLRQPGFVTMMSVSPDARNVLSVTERTDEQARGTVTSLVISDLAGGQSRVVVESTQDGPTIQVRSARFSEDGRRIVSVHGGYEAPESFLRLWELASNGEVNLTRTLRIPARLPPTDAALLLANQTHELVTLHGAAAYQWSLDNLEHQQSYRSHGAVTDAAFSADGRFVATSSESVKIWDAQTGKPLYKLEAPHEGAVYSVEFTPVDGSYLFATAGGDGAARLWEWAPEQATVGAVKTLRAGEAERILRDATFSSDGQLILAVGDDATAQVWSVADGQLVTTLADESTSPVDYLCGAFSADGGMVAVGGTDKQARLWDIDAEHLAAESNPPASILAGHADIIGSVAFLPSDGPSLRRVLTASRDRSARAWDAATGREIISLRKHSLGLTAVDATRDAATNAVVVLTAGLDGRLILWPAGP